MSKKILITDDVHALLPEGLSMDGFEVDFKPDISPDEVINIIESYEGLIVNSKVYVGKEMLDRAKKLKFMGRAGSGLEVFDLAYARQKGVTAFNSPEGNRNAVAEFALGALLNLMRHIAVSNAEVQQLAWNREKNRGEELNGKVVGLIAFGNTAQAFARILRGFEVEILAYDKYLSGFTDKYVRESTLEQIFERADVLSLHLPLTTETAAMVDYRFLSSFKKPYWLLNTSRGKVLKTDDMLQCLLEGKIKGAALDVLENEKLNLLTQQQRHTFERLIADERVMLSPHIAGWTYESKRGIAEVLLGKIRALNAVAH